MTKQELHAGLLLMGWSRSTEQFGSKNDWWTKPQFSICIDFNGDDGFSVGSFEDDNAEWFEFSASSYQELYDLAAERSI